MLWLLLGASVLSFHAVVSWALFRTYRADPVLSRAFPPWVAALAPTGYLLLMLLGGFFFARWGSDPFNHSYWPALPFFGALIFLQVLARRKVRACREGLAGKPPAAPPPHDGNA